MGDNHIGQGLAELNPFGGLDQCLVPCIGGTGFHNNLCYVSLDPSLEVSHLQSTNDYAESADHQS